MVSPAAAAPHRWPRLSRGRGRWIALVVAAVAVAGFWVLRQQPVDVRAVQPTSQPLLRTLLFSARVQAPARVEIGSTLTGRVERVTVDEGDAVAAGALLVQLEADELRAAVAQAEASLLQAQAQLAGQRAVSRPSADAALAQAQANLAAAERELARNRELVERGFISAARLDDVQRNVDVARAQRDAAQVQAAAQRGDGAEAEAAAAQREAAQAALQAARARLAQASLRAPAAARVIVRTVEPGQIVQPGRTLLTLAFDGPTELVALVDERFLGQLQIGQRAQVVADAYPRQPFGARVARLAPGVDAQRGAVEVRFALDGAPPAFLREDMTLSIEVITGQRDAARVLPLAALRDAGLDGSATVLVAADGRAETRALRLGLRTLDQVEVLDGLADGDAVLLDPRLEPGARVRPQLVDAATALRTAPGATSGDNPGGTIAGGMSR